MTLLVTGYEPFGEFEANPSGRVAEALDGTSVAGHEVVGRVLPVEFGPARERATGLVDDHDPAVALATGLAGGRAAVSVERFGVNVNDAVTTPDNAGADPVDEPVAPDGPAAYRASVPVGNAVAALLEAGVPARLSDDAGTHMCNDVLYAVRHHVETRGLDVDSGFVHLPLTPEGAVRRAEAPARGGSVPPSMGFQTQVEAVERVLETAVAAR